MVHFWWQEAPAGLPAAGLPPEVIGVIVNEFRSDSELADVRGKAARNTDFDLADAAQRLLRSRKEQAHQEAKRALHQGQAVQQLQQDGATEGALAAASEMWSAQLERLRREGDAAVRALMDRHEDELNIMRLDQVVKAHETGIRPERRSTELLNLRRSEAVLAAKQEYAHAFKVKARRVAVANQEASDAHMDWLLRCHSEQEHLMARQRRQLEGLQKRLADKLQDAELARDRDLERLRHRIKAANAAQAHDAKRERRHFAAALGGNLLNTRTTRHGASIAAAFPTLAAQSGDPGALPPRAASFASVATSQSQSGYLPIGRPAVPASVPASAPSPGRDRPAVRFAPTPMREAWAPPPPPSPTPPSPSQPPPYHPLSAEPGGFAPAPAPPPPANAAPSSAAVASGASAGVAGSGSSALTEAALRQMAQAQGGGDAQKKSRSTNSSSFKSNRPYAAGVAAAARR